MEEYEFGDIGKNLNSSKVARMGFGTKSFWLVRVFS
jgi:hypothetical protein